MSTQRSAITLRGDSLLRFVLKLDAVVTGLNGVAYVAAAPLLSDLFGLPAGVLRGVGVFLLAFAVVVWIIGTRETLRPAALDAVIVLNVAWVIGSVAIAALRLGSPTTVGAVWIVLQAIVVAGFAALQWAGLRRRS